MMAGETGLKKTGDNGRLCPRATYYEYDAENRTESVTQGYGGSESQTVNYHYNESGVIY